MILGKASSDAVGDECQLMAETSSSQLRRTADLGRPRIHDLKGGVRALPWTDAVGQKESPVIADWMAARCPVLSSGLLVARPV